MKKLFVSLVAAAATLIIACSSNGGGGGGGGTGGNGGGSGGGTGGGSGATELTAFAKDQIENHTADNTPTVTLDDKNLVDVNPISFDAGFFQ